MRLSSVVPIAVALCVVAAELRAQSSPPLSDLKPAYPAARRCSPLKSLYGSMIDLNGSLRDEPHSGVDGGRLGEPVLAPADGTVIAVWQADWGWGMEGALLIRHSRADLGLAEGPPYYYSEFDHLRYSEIRSMSAGKIVRRGRRLARVFRPGGDPQYLPEVHWEVWAVDDDAATRWVEDDEDGRYWINGKARLVDPLAMLALNKPPGPGGSVEVPPFDRGNDYRGYRGFTYILPCPRKLPPPPKSR